MRISIQTAFLFILMACTLVATEHGAAQAPQTEELKMTARFHVESDKDVGFLIVKIVIPRGSHIYSLNQKKPLSPSKLAVKNLPELMAGKTFRPDRKPKVIENDPVFETRVEKHSGTVQFFVPIKVDTGTEFQNVKPEVIFSGQICSDQGFCKLINNKSVRAEFAGFFDREAKKPPTSIK